MRNRLTQLFCVLGAAASLSACAGMQGPSTPQRTQEPQESAAEPVASDEVRAAVQAAIPEHDSRHIAEPDYQSRAACITAEYALRDLADTFNQRGIDTESSQCYATNAGTLYQVSFFYSPAPAGETLPDMNKITRSICANVQEAYDSVGMLREMATGEPAYTTTVRCYGLGPDLGIFVDVPVPGKRRPAPDPK